MRLSAPKSVRQLSKQSNLATPALSVPAPVRRSIPYSPCGVQWHLPRVMCGSLPQDNKDGRAVAAVADEADAEAPFLEPAVRSFALGVGAGVLLEFGHVLLEFMSAASAQGAALFTNLAVPPEVFETLGPQVAWDNLLAVTCCVLFYGMEVSVILPLLQKHGENKKEVVKALDQAPTLPKRLMPVKLQNVKRALYSLIALRNPSAALSYVGFRDDDKNKRFLGSPRMPANLGGPGTALLERPSTSTLPAPAEQSAKSAEPTAPTPTPNSLSSSLVRPRQRSTGTDKLQEKKECFRERQLAERRGYLNQCWYAAALSQNLTQDKPLEVKMLGRTVVLFRDADGKARCLDNLCPHRGAPLAQGWAKEVNGHSCVVCPYHGWAFDGEGKLRDVPSSANQDHLPKRPLVDSYPVEEKGGFVWLFFGNKSMPAAERPPVPVCEELSDPNWQPVYGELEFDAPHFSVFDNALDMAHIHYLHSDSFGNSSKPIIQDMHVQRDAWGISGSFRIYNKPVNALWEWTKVEDTVPVKFAAWLPSTSYVKIKLGAGVEMITFVNTVPIDANRSINRFCLIRNFAGWDGFDIWAKNAMYKILNEDKVMVEQLKPEHMPVEVSLEADKPQIALRKLRQEWVDLGMWVKPERTEGHNGSLNV